jgi:hypothetical protein
MESRQKTISKFFTKYFRDDIWHAANDRDWALVKKWIELKADFNSLNFLKMPILNIAIICDQFDIVLLLLKNKVNTELCSIDERRTGLHVSLYCGKKTAIKLLIMHGANCNEPTDNHGKTPYQAAQSFSNPEYFQLLKNTLDTYQKLNQLHALANAENNSNKEIKAKYYLEMSNLWKNLIIDETSTDAIQFYQEKTDFYLQQSQALKQTITTNISTPAEASTDYSQENSESSEDENQITSVSTSNSDFFKPQNINIRQRKKSSSITSQEIQPLLKKSDTQNPSDMTIFKL